MICLLYIVALTENNSFYVCRDLILKKILKLRNMSWERLNFYYFLTQKYFYDCRYPLLSSENVENISR
jgi:hypothetical protein